MATLSGSREIFGTRAINTLEASERRSRSRGKGRQGRTDQSRELRRVHGEAELLAMPETGELQITYAPRQAATPESEVAALANVYRYIFDCHAKKKATRPGGPDAGKEIDERSGKVIIPK